MFLYFVHEFSSKWVPAPFWFPGAETSGNSVNFD